MAPPPTSTVLPSPTKEVVIIDPTTQDDVSTLSMMTKNDLIKMLLQLHRNNHNLSSVKGFAPKQEILPHTGPNATEDPDNGSPANRGAQLLWQWANKPPANLFFGCEKKVKGGV